MTWLSLAHFGFSSEERKWRNLSGLTRSPEAVEVSGGNGLSRLHFGLCLFRQASAMSGGGVVRSPKQQESGDICPHHQANRCRERPVCRVEVKVREDGEI